MNNNTVTLACSFASGIIMRDPAGIVADVRLAGGNSFAGAADGEGKRMHLNHTDALGVTHGVDVGLWQRWSAAHTDMVPAAVHLVEMPPIDVQLSPSEVVTDEQA